MMDLIHNHNYIELYELQRRKEWNQATGMKATDAVGRRVGVLGYGSIGRQGKSDVSIFQAVQPITLEIFQFPATTITGWPSAVFETFRFWIPA